MLQVKHSKHMIDQAYLCEKKKTYVLKYFKSFLSIKQFIKLDELEELLIWTNMSIAKPIEDWFVEAEPFDKCRDLLENNLILKYQRMKFKDEKFQEITKDFLKLVHPRAALVEKFVDVLFKKEEWTSKRAAKDFYRIMAKEVIECNGPNSIFKQNFIEGQGLLPETVRFREQFESSMKEKFSEKKLGTFAMGELNSAEYATHFQLKVDADFKEGNDPDVQWKSWENVADQSDLDEFGKRFRLYVELPKEDEFEKLLSANVTHFRVMSELLAKCAFKRMVCKEQVGNIVKLLHLRDSMHCGPYMKLKFEDLEKLNDVVDKYLSEWKAQKYLSIRQIDDGEGTLSRIISLVETLTAKKYLVQDIKNLNEVFEKVQCTASNKYTAEKCIECLIVTSVHSNIQEEKAKTQLKSINLPIILVGKNLHNCFKDEKTPDKLTNVVDEYLSEWKAQQYLSIKGMQDVECTLSRLISVVESLLAPISNRYLVQDNKNLSKNYSDLQQITNDELIVENGLKCLIITSIKNSREENEARNKLTLIRVPTIFIGHSPRNCFEDEFDTSKLSRTCKIKIEDTEVSLSDLQTSTAKNVLQEELFLKENFPIVLALYRKPMRIESNPLIRDENFISRNIKFCENDESKTIKDDKIPHDMSDELESYSDIDGYNISKIIKNNKFSNVIISDQAGMGKSTEMINIAMKLREHKDYKNHLIVYFECKAAMGYLKCDIVTTICKMMKVMEKAHEFLIKSLIRQRKVVLLLDGIDEIGTSWREDLKEMLKSILNLGLFKIIIATRPHCYKFMEKIFHNIIVCQLPPFSEEDQMEYLIRFWKIDSIEDDDEHYQIKKNIEGLIARFRSMLKDGSLIGIPMQTYIIAVIYQEAIRSSDFEPPQPYTIGLIYKKFVDLKFRELIKRQFKMTSHAEETAINALERSFIPNHIEIAAHVYNNASEKVLEVLCSQAQMYGIVRLIPSVGFVHHTYFEYFSTLYFLTYKTNASKEFFSFMKQNLCPSRLSIATKFLDHHIGGINPNEELQTLRIVKGEKDAENEEIVEFVEMTKDFEPPSTARLHPEKLREFNYYLGKLSPADRYTLIRNSLNQSVFNVLEVLYDSLPRDTKCSLKFCFGNRAQKNFVNLKTLGGNQTLQLLGILLKKNPNNFVRKYLIDFSDGDKDYFEMTCRKPFVQVLNWLVDDLIATIDDQEREALFSYINHRFDKYFQLVVQHNNTDFFEEAIKRTKALWPMDTVNKFLMDRDVMNLFLKNVELNPDTKSLLVEERIKMIAHLYDLFKWAGCGNVILSESCTAAIDVLKNEAIQSAFRKQFQNQ
ncbi:uncharacterized protein LOC5572684 isoform X2 [Aedes aegypti]|nr:uncharacterized protein LOC5572684 isoform X2 [Aedes aegypti]